MKGMIYQGEVVKALERGKNRGLIGGIGVRFTNSSDRDLAGEYFTSSTYLGAQRGNGADVFFNHRRLPTPDSGFPGGRKQNFQKFVDHIFKPAKTYTTDLGLFVEAILDLSDEYERAIFDLVQRGKLSWSSASAPHTVRMASDGRIEEWPIIEFSLTPAPAEWRNKIAILDSTRASACASDARELRAIREKNERLRRECGWDTPLPARSSTPTPGSDEARRYVESALLRARHRCRQIELGL